MSDVDTLVKVDVFGMEDEHARLDHHRVGTTAERGTNELAAAMTARRRSHQNW
jgi:hypothetical protein